MNKKEAELDNCKYCNSKLDIIKDYFECNKYTIVCEGCGMSLGNFDRYNQAVAMINTRPEPPVGEWEEEFENEFYEIYCAGYHETYQKLKDFIRKLIKPKPSWGEVEEEFKKKFSGVGYAYMPSDSDVYEFEDKTKDILNHFKQYFTEGE